MSETTNLKLFKHDNPSTNTNEFNVDIALNQNWDKIDSFVGTVNSKILEIQNKNTEQDEKISSMQSEIELIQEKDNVQDTKLAELQAENERLRKDINGLPSGQATAETIYLTDSAEMRFKKFGIGGNSKQETSTKSRNICFTEFSKWESGDYDGNAGTKVSNTARIRLIELLPVKPSTTYYLNLYNSSNYKFIVRIYDINQKITRSPGAITNGDTITTTENEYYIAVIIYNTTTTVNYDTYQTAFKDGTIKPFICLDSETDKNYDEYSVAMPSPDYPSEVKSCGDNINYFDEELELGSIDNTTGENAENNSTIRSKNHIAVLSNQELTISNDKQYSNYIYEYDKDKNFIKYTANNQNPYTFITSSTTKYIKFRTIATSKQNELTTKFKLEKGKVATPYSPYGQGCINEVICNKNFFNSELEMGGYSGSNGQPYNSTTRVRSKEKTYLKAGTYTISSTKATLICAECWNNDKTYNREYISLKDNLTITLDKDSYIHVTIENTLLLESNVQIEEGSTATDYIPHEEQTYTIPTQQPMRAVGDIRDTFVKKNNKWYERHYIPRYYFTGNESWTKNASFDNTFFTGRPQGIKANEARLMSNITNWFGANYYSSKDCVMAVGSSFNIKNANISTVDDFKAYLKDQYNAGTPVYVDYVSDTPIDIECIPEQNEILDKIEQEAHTYKNVTHIYSTDEVKPVEDVEYIKDIETLINKAITVVE